MYKEAAELCFRDSLEYDGPYGFLRQNLLDVSSH